MNDRKTFLENAGGFLALSAASPFLGATTLAPITSGQRAYVAGKYAIELDGVAAGWLQKATGGSVFAEPPPPTDKQKPPPPVDVRVEPIAIECGAGMSRAFYNWLKGSFGAGGQRKDGSIIAADYDYREVWRLNFFNATLSDITFPALDAASKDAAFLSLKINAERIRRLVPGGSVSQTFGGANPQVQKRWLPSNFRLTIPSIDCKSVSKIERIASGGPQNLVVTLAESHSADFSQWKLLGGSKSATLEYLEPNLQTPLFVLTFGGVQPARIEPDKLGGPESLRRTTVTLGYGNVALTQTPA